MSFPVHCDIGVLIWGFFVGQDGPVWSPNAFNTEVNGRPAYATSDLFEEHPDDPNLFRVYGRADDQIVLSTGEKVSPLDYAPLYDMLTTICPCRPTLCPWVSNAISYIESSLTNATMHL